MCFPIYMINVHVCIITDPNQLVTGDRGPSSSYEISTEEGDFKAELEVVWDSEPMRVS